VVDAEPVVEDRVGGKAVWEDSPDKREASLRERKAQMILAARQYVVFFFSRFGVGDEFMTGGCWRSKRQSRNLMLL
jgi:hypothetical protein